MDKAIKNTMYNFKFEDGTSEDLTLAFYALYQLKAKNKPIYEEYNRIMTKGVNEELETITVLYAAYLCANISDISGCMSLEEFMIKCGSNRGAIKEAMEYLVKPKKQ